MFAVSSVKMPPPGMASCAFTARFMTICSTCPRSAVTDANSGRRPSMNLHVFPDETSEHGPHADHHVVQVKTRRLDDLLAAEGQQLTRESRGPCARFLN